MMIEILALIFAAMAGAGALYAALRLSAGKNKMIPAEQFEEMNAQFAAVTIEKTKAAERAAMFEESLQRTINELASERSKTIVLSSSLATAENEIKNVRQRIDEQKTEMQELHDRFSSEFKNLANEILEEKSKKFTDLNKENLAVVLAPLQERIKDFHAVINETYGKDSRERATLAEQIRSLTLLNQQMTKEASDLTSALKGQSKTQGDWGELILEQILDKSGLVKGTHYTVQQSMQDEGGKVSRPDVIIHLPEGKHLVIDSKVSLTAYTDYSRTEEKELQKTYLTAHIQSIRKHIKELSEKKYQSLYQLQSVDFVLMFVPLEPAFAAAVKSDIGLFNEAFEKNIVIVTASTLMATLRTISSIWRQENQSRNAVEIAKKSGDLYDKFVGFLEDLKSIGDKIQSSQKAYDEAVLKLSTGRGNIIKRAEELKQMGAKTTKALPANLVDKASDAELLPG